MNAQLLTAVPASSPTEEVLEPVANVLKPLIGLTLKELEQLMADMKQPAFRAAQLHHWLYVSCARSFDAMNNLAKDFRTQLAARFTVGTLALHSKQKSSDGTIKYLFRLADGEVVESVLMHFEVRNTYSICISTQVGCAMNCSFCATGKIGLKRNLTTAEIVEQYLFVQQDCGKEIRNVVFMGQGEPLHNYDNLVASLRLLNTSAEVGMRRMTVSTSGLVPAIEKLAAEEFPITLAISLHAPDDETRNQIMPLNKKYPLARLLPALRKYVEVTHRRLTIEYILIDGLNDTDAHAHALGKLLKGLMANVNLIPYNPISADLPNCPDYKRSSRAAIRHFSDVLFNYGKKVTIRTERGADIDAACGQLANRFQGTSAKKVPVAAN
jgi:23S rRNA (adenine2503-C2)-methyltransferase